VNVHRWRFTLLMVLVFSGCGTYEEDKLSNDNPGINSLNVVVAFGDSITQGSECSCIPYPKRLAGLIGKTVYNTGVGGSKATSNIGRTQSVINQYHPAYMLILYGINDVIHSYYTVTILPAIRQMASICKQNNVVPVLATYPIPIAGHHLFAGGALRLNAGIRSIAEEEGLECVDLEKEFALAPDSTDPALAGADPALMEADGLHPNDAGTQIMALAFADLF
jgi:lysophospholipase L1-like esterase